MPSLITADWHLDDQPQNAYRWAVFDRVMFWIESQHPLKNVNVYMLGDLGDRKDRHSASMVTRMTDEFMRLIDTGANIFVQMGNHDMPLKGAAYWGLLNKLRAGVDVASGISFFTEPTRIKDLLILPYSDNPAEDWKEIDFTTVKAAFIHQTVTGATSRGITLSNLKMPAIPDHVIVYSGDIHTPQQIGNVTYVGAPHPVSFGDTHETRMLELDDGWNLAKVIKVKATQRLMLRIRDSSQLDTVITRPGDQAKVICTVPVSEIDLWPAMQDAIVAWATARDVTLFSVEPEIEAGPLATAGAGPEMRENDPAYVLRAFADAEHIDDPMFDYGLQLLKEISGE